MWRLHRGTLGYVMVMAVLLLVIRLVGQSIAAPSTPLVYAFLLLTMPAALVVLPLTAIADDAVGGPFNPLASDAVFTAGVLLAFLLNEVFSPAASVHREDDEGGGHDVSDSPGADGDAA